MVRRVGMEPATPTTELLRGETPRGPSLRMLQMRISERRLLLMFGDICFSLLSILISLRLWAAKAGEPFTPQFILPHAYWFVILPVLWLVLANANDYYNLRVAARLQSSLMRLALITAQLLLVYLAVFFLSPRGSLPRRFIVYYAVTSLFLTGLWRACRLFLIGWTGFRRRAVIVGSGRAADMIRTAMEEEALGDYEVIGCVSSVHDLAELNPAEDHLPILGTGDDLPTLVHKLGISELVMAYINEVPDDIFQGVMSCYEQGIPIAPMPVLYEQITGRVPIEHVGEHLWALVLPTEGHTLGFHLYLFLKRTLDILLSFAGLLIFSPFLPLLAIAIKLDSPGPVFYRQQRLGRGGHPFAILKLRSMVAAAEQDSVPRWAVNGDSRITRAGKFLRKTRLDEVPQLVNVLRGDMSIIGPRPERPAFVQMLASEIPFYRTRLAVKPGLSGWAQVRYRYGNTTEDALRKLQYDLYYIRHQSLAMDLIILVKTIGTVLALRGT